ncbi:Kelch repeat-containing protein [Hymenobacter crusticola]|uniref:Attractin/MKLN-like beta-propeller domain-containing protein n=1 Tax=Hymenobacter crusticola TaxID=1770526 RepID=A0A243W6Z3_9BACT|nr:kelch repeat-containing protein [Hymenobacter crusticola]OUJ70360.1 hypothetical protein BXP70_24275 [Hymenobacter crusticola]
MAPLTQRRSQHGAAAIGNNIYTWGGYIATTNNSIPGTVFNSLEIYNTATNTWSSGAPMPVAERSQAVAASGDFLYGFGGNASTRNAFRYNVRTNTWSTIAALPTGAFEAAAAAGADGSIYVFGGYTTTAVVVNNTQIYNPTTDSWTAGAPMPTARNGQAAITDAAGLIHVIGGVTSTLAASAVHEVYNPATRPCCTHRPKTRSKSCSNTVAG